jgi:putative selenate reductase
MELGQADESGRRRPISVKGSEFELKFNSIITAIGQDIVIVFLPGEKLQVNSNTYKTQFENVFAGGDVLRGADSLINAIGDGRTAAKRIIEKSKNESHKKIEVAKKLSLSEFQKKQSHREYGIKLPEIDLSKRKSFELVNPVLTHVEAIKEAERCLYCNDVCNICVGVCPNFANVAFESNKMRVPVYTVYSNGEHPKFEITNYFEVEQKNQILNVADFCNECGNCVTFCPTNGSPFQTKPRFYLTEDSFNKEEYGYYLSENLIKYKNKLGIEYLFLKDNLMIYESDSVVVNFDKNNFYIIDLKIKPSASNEMVLQQAAEMYYLFINLNNHALLV